MRGKLDTIMHGLFSGLIKGVATGEGGHNTVKITERVCFQRGSPQIDTCMISVSLHSVSYADILSSSVSRKIRSVPYT